MSVEDGDNSAFVLKPAMCLTSFSSVALPPGVSVLKLLFGLAFQAHCKIDHKGIPFIVIPKIPFIFLFCCISCFLDPMPLPFLVYTLLLVGHIHQEFLRKHT